MKLSNRIFKRILKIRLVKYIVFVLANLILISFVSFMFWASIVSADPQYHNSGRWVQTYPPPKWDTLLTSTNLSFIEVFIICAGMYFGMIFIIIIVIIINNRYQMKRWINVPDYYTLFDKYNRLKRKYKEDTTKLQSIINKQNKLIVALKERNKSIKAREMYQIWLKEREKVIKLHKENTKLLDEIISLKERLALTIKDGALLLKLKS